MDTLVVAAGVSALQPLMAIAGVDTDSDNILKQATKEGVQRVADVAAAATQGNYVGPLISAVTFVGFSPASVLFFNIADTNLGVKGPNAIEHIQIPINTPCQLPGIRHSSANAHSLCINQSRISRPLPSPLNRTS